MAASHSSCCGCAGAQLQPDTAAGRASASASTSAAPRAPGLPGLPLPAPIMLRSGKRLCRSCAVPAALGCPGMRCCWLGDATLLSRGCGAALPRMRCCSPGDAMLLSRGCDAPLPGCSGRCSPPPNRPDTGPCYLCPRRPAPAPPSRTFSAHLLVTSSRKELNRRSGSGNVNRPKLPQNQLFTRLWS